MNYSRFSMTEKEQQTLLFLRAIRGKKNCVVCGAMVRGDFPLFLYFRVLLSLQDPSNLIELQKKELRKGCKSVSHVCFCLQNRSKI